MADATEQAPKDLIGFLDFYFVKKAPFQIPEGGKEFIVKFGPWITLVLMIITLPLILGALGLSLLVAPAVVVTGGGLIYIGLAFAVVQLVMSAIALPGLFARKMSGWTMLFYARLVGFVGGVLSGSIIGPILGLVIGLYILFQIRSKYA
jgi:hypothetical protein